jgi:peptide deformylase
LGLLALSFDGLSMENSGNKLVKYPSNVLSRPNSMAELNYTDDNDDLSPEFLEEYAPIWGNALEVCRRHDGLAIAAPQVGFLETWWVEADGTVIVNPVVLTPDWLKSHPMAIGLPAAGLVEAPEGCLSLPGVFAKVRRWNWVVLEARRFKVVWSDSTYQASDLGGFRTVVQGDYARMVQHEFDHTRGRLYTSYLTNAERSRIHGTVRKGK